jgi:hypothetical protein
MESSNYPYYIAIDSHDNVFVTDSSNYRVQKFDNLRKLRFSIWIARKWKWQFSAPMGIAIDSSDNIYVTDAPNYRVQKFDSSGNYLSQFGSYGTGNGEFNWPTGIRLDSSNNIYVVDSDNQRIQKFDSSGNYETQFGSSGTGDGEFAYPSDLYIDAGGYVYVTDGENHRVQTFSPPVGPSVSFNIEKTSSGAPNFTYLNVVNSNNVSSDSFNCLTGCTNSGGNTNWIFAQVSTVAHHHSRTPSTPAFGINIVSPDYVYVNSSSTEIEIIGTGFAAGDVALLSGTELETTLNSDRSITAKIPSSLLSSPATTSVSVKNMDGISSNSLEFYIQEIFLREGILSQRQQPLLQQPQQQL